MQGRMIAEVTRYAMGIGDKLYMQCLSKHAELGKLPVGPDVRILWCLQS